MKSGQTTYLSVTATATLVRKALREAFPDFTFSVRSKSYSGGASINVRWTDGPRVSDVEAITKVFEGSTFDGMQDYKGGRIHTINGQHVSFGADWIFCDREYSEAFLKKAMQHWDGLPSAKRCDLLNKGLPRWGIEPGEGLQPTPKGMASILSDFEPQPSKTAESVVLVRVY